MAGGPPPLELLDAELKADRKPAADRSAAGRRKGEVPIMKDIENIVLPDEAPEIDALEQRFIIDGGYETGLDTTYLDTIRDQDANEADLIDQATVVPVPEDFGLQA